MMTPVVFPTQTSRIGKRGSWVVPAKLRHFYGLEEGALVIAESRPEGVLLRPATATPLLQPEKQMHPAWKSWLVLRAQLNLTPEDVAALKEEGQR